MRRENSSFKTSFVSYEGSKLYNNDYYGCAELDKLACYVVADGIGIGDVESESAKVAVQAAISAFHERPSMKKRALKRYIRAAHKALLENRGRKSLRASITVVVTNYQKLRYAWAGNARFYLYRAGRLITQSQDHSLSVQMVKRGQLEVDKVAKHEERANLARYAGQPGKLTPQASKKIKLNNGDIFTVLTRGVWECCDTGDILAALDGAENDPQLAVEGLERLILDPSPEEIDNYTAAVVFVDKTYIDPNKGKKLKKFLLIAIPVLIILIAIIIVLVILHNRNQAKRREMGSAYQNAIVFVESDNFIRAVDELDISVRLP